MNELVEKYLNRHYLIFGNYYVKAISLEQVSIQTIINDLCVVFGSTKVESSDYMLYWVDNFEKNAETNKQTP